MSAGFSGEDVQKLKPAGVPLFGISLDIEHYFDVHHSAADTPDKIEPVNLKKSVAAVATMAFVVADGPGTWDAPAPGREPQAVSRLPQAQTPRRKDGHARCGIKGWQRVGSGHAP